MDFKIHFAVEALKRDSSPQNEPETFFLDSACFVELRVPIKYFPEILTRLLKMIQICCCDVPSSAEL